MKKLIFYIILLFSLAFNQSRTVIYNNGDPVGEGGHPIYWNGDEGASLSNRFSVIDDYVLEGFSIWASMSSPFGSIRAVLQADNDNSPGEELGQWVITLDGLIPEKEYLVLTTDECIYLEKNNSYWLSVHADDEITTATWLYSPQSFYTYTESSDYGGTWDETTTGQAGAGIIAGEKIYYTDISPHTGDVNFDNTVDVLDIVSIVQYVMGNLEFSNDQVQAADINGDQTINVLDVVGLVSSILNDPDPMSNWLLEDVNPHSISYGQMLGPETFPNEVSVFYFGKQG